MMDYLLWVISIVALLFFCLMLIGNWNVFYENFIKKNTTISAVPLLGGIVGVVGLWLMPIGVDNKWLFLPLIVEWGSFPLIITFGVSRFIKTRTR